MGDDTTKIQNGESVSELSSSDWLSAEREKQVKESQAAWHSDWLKTGDRKSKDVVESYRLELETGVRHCSSHLKPLWGNPKCSICPSFR
jgi:hypothetical protein